jgi:hypothetical protein
MLLIIGLEPKRSAAEGLNRNPILALLRPPQQPKAWCWWVCKRPRESPEGTLRLYNRCDQMKRARVPPHLTLVDIDARKGGSILRPSRALISAKRSPPVFHSACVIALIHWVSANSASQTSLPCKPSFGEFLISLSVSPLASEPMQLGAACCSSLIMLELLEQL